MRIFTCGTRAVDEVTVTQYVVVCATCGFGGARFSDKVDATRRAVELSVGDALAAVELSGRRCPSCGAK